MEPALSDFIDKMPKIELHVHLEGSVDVDTLLELAMGNRIDLPRDRIEEARRPQSYASFDHFAKAFLMTVHCVRRLDDFALLVHRHGAAMYRQNIRYAEVTWTPQLYGHLRLPLDDILEALNAGRSRARRDWGVEMRWIPDLVRSVPGPASRVQAWAVSNRARDGGVVALGLGGPESENLHPDIREAFARARAAGLPANPHAGEGAGPASVRTALHDLAAVRIGHGVRAVEDPELVSYLAEHRVPLEVCPTSNVVLGVFGSYADHPLKRLFAAGCCVTVNSDDPALFGSGLASEYRHAVTSCGLSLRELKSTVMAAAASAYLPDSEKQTMARSFHAEVARLEGEVEAS